MNIRIPAWLADLAERSGWTFIQTFLGLIVAVDTLNATAAQAAGIGALAAALAVVKTAVAGRLLRPPSTLWGDILDRTVSTFLEVFLAAVIVSPGVASTWQLAWVSAWPAALAVLKAGIAARVGQLNSASTLPASLDATPARPLHLR